MAEIVNLRQRRRQLRRAADAQGAADNRARHGRTRAERALDALKAARREAALDGARVEPPSGDAAPGEPPATGG